MNISTAILGIVLLAAMSFALRHVWNNVKTGKHDCCGSSGCSSCVSAGCCGGGSGGTCHCGELPSSNK